MMSKQKINTEQGVVIEHLNKYLSYHNLPIKIDEGGICHALATLYIHYVLEGKEKNFIQLLSYIAQKAPKPNEELDAELFTLIEKILVLQVNKERYTRNRYNQANSYQQLHVNGIYLHAGFQLGLKTSLTNWAHIIEQINLKPNEVIRASANGHSIAIARTKNGAYKVYDPNNSVICKKCHNAAGMMKYLANEAFNFSLFTVGSTLDLHIDIISAQEPDYRNFPDKKALLEQYVTLPQKRLGNDGGALYYAIKYDDADAAAYILLDNDTNLSDKELIDIATQIVLFDASHSLKVLLDKLRLENKIHFLESSPLLALNLGSARCFQQLLQEKEFREIYTLCIEHPKGYPFTLKKVFSGMNDELISKVLHDVKEHHGVNVFNEDILIQLVEESIKRRNHHAITLLDKKIDNLHERLVHPKQRLELLIQAIKKNDPLMVRVLINKLRMSAEELNCVNISYSTVYKYNVEIFLTLQLKGYEFKPNAEELIQKKKSQRIGIIEYLGIALIRFSEFITQQNKSTLSVDKVNRYALFSKSKANSDEEPIVDSCGLDKGIGTKA